MSKSARSITPLSAQLFHHILHMEVHPDEKGCIKYKDFHPHSTSLDKTISDKPSLYFIHANYVILTVQDSGGV